MKPTLQEIVDNLPRLRNQVMGGHSSPYTHAAVIPYATYAPWISDRAFAEVYARLAGRTLVDVYRCHELWQLAQQAARLEGCILEVGVWRGGTAALLGLAARSAGFDKELVLCDTFTGVAGAGENDSFYRGGEHADTTRPAVQAFLASMGVERLRVIEGVFPSHVAAAVEGERFCFGHIDVDVYRSAREVFEWLWPRLSQGGIIVFDDYGFLHCDGVTRFVEEIRGRPGLLLLHNLNGHAVVVKTVQD